MTLLLRRILEERFEDEPDLDEDFSIPSNPRNLVYTFLAVLVLVLLCKICMAGRRRRIKKTIEAQESSIFTYLQQFEVEDIDLRKSPPGGWHVTYLNKLAYGVNLGEKKGLDGETDLENYDNDSHSAQDQDLAFTHSSIVKDSLFMDTSSKPALGDSVSSGFVDSYDDLKPRSYEDTPEQTPGSSSHKVV